MKIGTVILVLLLALFGSGFLLSQTMHLTEELNANQEQLARLQLEKQSLEAQYQALLNERNQLAQRATGLSVENEELHSQLDAMQTERRNLNDQIATLQNQLQVVQRSNRLVTGLANALTGHIALAILILPSLPLSMGAVYVMTHPKKTKPDARQTYSSRHQGTIQATLTRDELHQIAQQRRLKGE